MIYLLTRLFSSRPLQPKERFLLTAVIGALVAKLLYRKVLGYDYSHKVVLITGGSRGLGFVLAKRLLREQAKVIICARDQAELQRASQLLCREGSDLFTVVCDIRNQDEVQSMVRSIQSTVGPIDVVINNAGIIQTGPLESMKVDDFENAMQTHFYGPLYTIEAVLPSMIKRRCGRIVNIASIGGRISIPHLVPYCASKHALVGLTLGIRSELTKHGISVSAICPGLMRTGSPRNAQFKGQHRKEYVWFKTSDSLPLLSTGAERAARQILEVAGVGRAFYVVGLPHKIADKFHALAPGLFNSLLGYVNRLLPEYAGIKQEQLAGSESKSPWSESWINSLTDRAAIENNEHWTS